jgi:ADP-ribose pyrophosphatase YjhB (NUDIX family)
MLKLLYNEEFFVCYHTYMKDTALSKPLDHFIQAEIITKLAASDKAIRFSELKEAGIENSLFMYHANKLIDRGLISKTDDGFALTLKGARWANYAGTFHDFSVTTPRPLVQFIITDHQNNVLLAQRKGQIREQLNDYLLPGNIYRYGLTLDENVALILSEIFGEIQLPPATLITTMDVIHTAEDGFVNHVLSHILTVQFTESAPATLDHSLFTTEWLPARDIRLDNELFTKSAFLPLLFAKLADIKAHEVFRIKSK